MDAADASTTVSRVVLKNFRSIESCDVRLGAMTLLVGPNGSGKSNFLDALKLTRDALRTNLENAIRERGGIDDVRRRSTGHPTHFGLRFDVNTESGRAEYGYQVAARSGFTFEVQKEVCRVFEDGKVATSFTVENGVLTSPSHDLRSVRLAKDALALPLVGAYPAFAPVASALADMGFYNFNPDRARDLQDPDTGDVLAGDGRNLASVIRRLASTHPDVMTRVVDYLGTVVPGIRSVSARAYGPKETVEFRQEVVGGQSPWKFDAASVSDGTLRALCVLVAAFQEGISLVGIEEPETAVHPGAARRVMDALLEASERRQMIFTTHSPDLLDHPDIDIDSVVAVQSERGTSQFGRVDQATRDAVRNNLYTPGDLLRLEQIKPDIFSPTPTRVRLF